MQPKNCKLSRYYFRLEHWYLQAISQTNDETLYIHAKSNHPANILKQLPISIETRLSNLSSNPEIYHEASKHYQNILNQSGYDYKLQYKPPNNDHKSKSKSSKNRRRNIIWFNLPFSENVSNNISKYHCVKKVRIRSYSGPYFPAFGPET